MTADLDRGSRLGAGVQEFIADRAVKVEDFAADWLDFDPRPRIVIKRNRDILWHNGAARQHLTPPQPAFMQSGRLEFVTNELAKSFEESLAELTSKPTRIPVGASSKGHAIIANAHCRTHDDNKIIFLLLAISPAFCSVDLSGLSATFRLTPAEANVIDGICAMEQPSAIAHRLGVSVHTVRSHLRNIFSKTNVGSQLALLRLALVYEIL